MTVILALETTQREGGIALRDAGGVVHRRLWTDSGPRANERLLPAIEEVCRDTATMPQAIQAVGVSIGPGGFTGTRIGISAAKMIALALGADLVAVPTVHAVAEALEPPGDTGPVLVTLAVKGDRVWAALLERAGAGWRDLRPAGSMDVHRLPWGDARYAVGDRHLPDAARDDAARAGRDIVEPRFDPAAVVRLTDVARTAGATIAPARLRPLYARPPEAVRLWTSRPRP